MTSAQLVGLRAARELEAVPGRRVIRAVHVGLDARGGAPEHDPAYWAVAPTAFSFSFISCTVSVYAT